MVIRRAAGSTGRAGVTPRAPGRRAAVRCPPRLSATIGMMCAVAGFGAANLGAVHAVAAMARSHAAARARTHAAAKAHSHAAARPHSDAAAQAGVIPASSRTRSGLPWASGAYLPGGTPAAASAFGTWRKRPLDIGEVWLDQSTWAGITDPAWLYRRWQGSPYTMAISVAMLPTHVRGASIQTCASGGYNVYWRQFGQVIRSSGWAGSSTGTDTAGRPPTPRRGRSAGGRPSPRPGPPRRDCAGTGTSTGVRPPRWPIPPGPIPGITT